MTAATKNNYRCNSSPHMRRFRNVHNLPKCNMKIISIRISLFVQIVTSGLVCASSVGALPDYVGNLGHYSPYPEALQIIPEDHIIKLARSSTGRTVKKIVLTRDGVRDVYDVFLIISGSQLLKIRYDARTADELYREMIKQRHNKARKRGQTHKWL